MGRKGRNVHDKLVQPSSLRKLCEEEIGMKKKLAVFCVLILILWIFLGVLSRRDIFYLIRINQENRQHDQIGDSFLDGIDFGIGYTEDNTCDGSSFFWLGEAENKKLARLIAESPIEGFIYYDNWQTGNGVKEGYLHVIPSWIKSAGLQTVLRPFFPKIKLFYCQDENYLYISDDVKELAYDYCRGISITNVPSADFHQKATRE